MRHRRLLVTLTIAALVLVAVPVTAFGSSKVPGAPEPRFLASTAVGDAINYQGRLTENGGPANGQYDIQFILYDAVSGGAQVTGTATIAKDNVNVTNGVFSVDLDFGANAFNGDARWVEIGVRPGVSTGTYTVLSPRQPITATPYALYAKKAGSIAVPFSASGASASPTSLVDIQQAGTGNALSVHATTDTAIFGESTSGKAAAFKGEVQVDGALTRKYGSSFAGAAPIAYGIVKPDGTIETAGSTSNFTVAWSVANSRYEITITAENYQYYTHVAVVTAMLDGTPGTPSNIAATASLSGKLIVKLVTGAAPTVGVQGYFQFVVFKP